MKKLLTIFAALALITLVSANMPGNTAKDMAKVNQQQGMYLFADCSPIAEYEYLGTVKNKVGMGDLGVGNDDYETVKKRLIKKAKKEYPDGDGIIFNLAKAKGEADVIKFK